MECLKSKYRDEKSALDDIKLISKKSNRTKIPIRAYLCRHCSSWHLTSAPDFTSIKEENEILKKELKKISQEFINYKKSERKGLLKEIKKESYVSQLKSQLSKKKEIIKHLRNNNSELISKNIQLIMSQNNGTK